MDYAWSTVAYRCSSLSCTWDGARNDEGFFFYLLVTTRRLRGVMEVGYCSTKAAAAKSHCSTPG